MKPEKIIGNFKTILSAFLFFLFHISITNFSYFLHSPTEIEVLYGYNSSRHIIVTLVISLLFMYSYLRFQTMHNNRLRREYFAFDEKPKFFVFVSKKFDFWFELFCFAYILTAYDLKKLFPVLDELTEKAPKIFSSKLTVVLTVLAVFVATFLLARYNAIQYWIQNYSKTANPSPQPETPSMTNVKNFGRFLPTRADFSAARFMAQYDTIKSWMLENQEEIDCRYTKKEKLKSFASILFIYSVCTVFGKAAYDTVTGIIFPVAKLLFVSGVVISVAVIILSVFLFRRLRMVLKRRSFLKELKNVASENGFELSEISFPYSSLFSPYKGENFSIKANGKTYSCKLLSCIKASQPLILNDNGVGTYIHTITFARVQWYKSTKSFKFDYDSENEKILIVNPPSKFVYSVWKGRLHELDNFDRVGDYSVHTAGSFLRSLTRDCLSDFPNKSPSQ